MNSIRSRLLLASAFVLAVFVLAIAAAVSWSVEQRADAAQEDRLRGLVYGILGATEVKPSGRVNVNAGALPDPALLSPSSDIQASIHARGQLLWQSSSSVVLAPSPDLLPIGAWRFAEPGDGGDDYRLQFSTAWLFDDGEEFPFEVQVLDRGDALARELGQFDRSLWWTLSVAALLLLAIQWFLLRRALAPLAHAGDTVAAIERGEQDRFDDDVVRELQPLTRGLNAMLDSERARQQGYRHLVDDLAHTLRTPLTVLKNAGSDPASNADTGELRRVLMTQTGQIERSLERTVARARQRRGRYLGSAVALAPVVERVAASIEKLYSASSVMIDVDIDADTTVRIDSADLYEVFGNLLDNACRYGATHVQVAQVESSADVAPSGSGASSVTIRIADNGPGFGVTDPEVLFERGARADLGSAGSGSGLAATRQLLANQRGEVLLENGGPLAGEKAGAMVMLSLPV